MDVFYRAGLGVWLRKGGDVACAVLVLAEPTTPPASPLRRAGAHWTGGGREGHPHQSSLTLSVRLRPASVCRSVSQSVSLSVCLSGESAQLSGESAQLSGQSALSSLYSLLNQ